MRLCNAFYKGIDMIDTTRRTLIASATIAGAALVAPQAASAKTQDRAAMTFKGGTAMADEMTFEEVEKLLDLKPNATCGYVRVTFMSKERIAPGGLPAPFSAGRPMGSALYFMLTPQEPVKLHRIMNDQLYHYYMGDPIEVLMMLEDGSTQFHVVGPDLRGGQVVQLHIPGGTFHTARVIGERRWFLGASTEWPGVEPADVELGKADELVKKFPKVAEEIKTWPLPAKQ
jgi:predicted cupin superfamily sugar epimerase